MEGDQAGVVGTAAELGVAVYEGIDPEDVEILEDGRHQGPPKFAETDKKVTGAAGMKHHEMAMKCPCGHFIRRVCYTDRPEYQTVTCEGATATVEELQEALAQESEDTEQQTLAEATA